VSGEHQQDKEDAMAFGPWNTVTKHGYALDEVVSALQKSCRRCDLDGAIFWATEMNESGYGAYCWRRLAIVTSEDVFLASPEAPAVVAGLWTLSQMLLASQPKPEKGRPTVHPPLQLLQAAWYLARLPKNRELADACDTMYVRAKAGRLPSIEDPAIESPVLDMHTRRGRAMGRGHVHFETMAPEGARWIENAVEVDGNRWGARFDEEYRPLLTNAGPVVPGAEG
jgi:replication-associated recombination protein RarA